MSTQLRVSIFIQTTPPMNGFEITLLADHTILKPAGIDLTGTILGANPTILEECLQGVRVIGTACPATDTIDTLHLTAVASPGGLPGGLTPPGASGLLFTALYNVTASTTSTPLGYQTGCSNSSVAGTTTCVDIANGGQTAVPENVQTAVFTTADFTISANPSAISIPRSSQASSTITLTSLSGFAGTVSLSTNVSPSNSRSPTVALGSSSFTLGSGGSGSVVLTISTPKNAGFGSYTVVVTGTSGSLTHTTTLSVTVVH